MRIVVLCEGTTEAALKGAIHEFVNRRTSTGGRTGIATRSMDGHVLRKKLPKLIDLYGALNDVRGIIALTDVYPRFRSANEARGSLQRLADTSAHVEKFRAHAAQFELEAWLMPFWSEIARSLRLRARPPGAKPEEINDENPPSKRLATLYTQAKQHYEKVIDGPKWLTAERLERAANECPELKSFFNSLLELSEAELLP